MYVYVFREYCHQLMYPVSAQGVVERIINVRYYYYYINKFIAPYNNRQWAAADAEIKVQSVENTELKGSPFKTWSRSVYSHTCYAYCQGFLPCLFLPFRSIYLHFPKISPSFFPVLAVANTASCVGPQNKIGHPAGCRFLC